MLTVYTQRYKIITQAQMNLGITYILSYITLFLNIKLVIIVFYLSEVAFLFSCQLISWVATTLDFISVGLVCNNDFHLTSNILGYYETFLKYKLDKGYECLTEGTCNNILVQFW
jgi:hypothetical protein